MQSDDELTVPFAIPQPAPYESMNTSLQVVRYGEGPGAEHLFVRAGMSRNAISVIPAI